jgi:hypothetical protein
MPIRLVEAPEKRGVATRATDRNRQSCCYIDREGWGTLRLVNPSPESSFKRSVSAADRIHNGLPQRIAPCIGVRLQTVVTRIRRVDVAGGG